MPAVFSISRHGSLLTLTQGIGLPLLRGDLKSKHHAEARVFRVERAAIQSSLAIMPDRFEGTPDAILERIEAMFTEWTGGDEEPRPERQPAPLRPVRETPPVPVEVKAEEKPPPRPEDKPVAPAAPPPRAARIPEPTRSLRTYQLLFETARRQLYLAEAVPSSSTHSLIGAGVFVAFAAEAFFNDLGSRIIPSWSQLQRLDPREKAEILGIELFNNKVDWSNRPFQSVAAALGFRRALAHAHAETFSFDQIAAAGNKDSEVPRTRRTAWQEHCDVATMQQWITDVRLVMERFARAHDPSAVPITTVEPLAQRR
jgi:hypothetical protein